MSGHELGHFIDTLLRGATSLGVRIAPPCPHPCYLPTGCRIRQQHSWCDDLFPHRLTCLYTLHLVRWCFMVGPNTLYRIGVKSSLYSCACMCVPSRSSKSRPRCSTMKLWAVLHCMCHLEPDEMQLPWYSRCFTAHRRWDYKNSRNAHLKVRRSIYNNGGFIIHKTHNRLGSWTPPYSRTLPAYDILPGKSVNPQSCDFPTEYRTGRCNSSALRRCKGCQG